MTTAKDRLFVAAAILDTTSIDRAIQEYKAENGNRFYTDEVKDTDDRRITHYACLYNTEDVALHVLSIDKYGNGEDKYGAYPYMYAARRGFHQLLQGWQDKYNIKATDQCGRNALHYCCGDGADSKASVIGSPLPDQKANQTDLLKCAEILAGSVDINKKDNKGTYPIQLAVKQDYIDIFRLLLSQNEKPDYFLCHQPYMVAYKFMFPDDILPSFEDLIENRPKECDLYDVLRKICDLTVRVLYREPKQITAVKDYRLHCAESIINSQKEFVFASKSPLYAAVDTEFYEMITFLSNKGAKVVLKEEKGTYEPIINWFTRTLFRKDNGALINHKLLCFRKLVEECKLDVNITDDRGMSPLHQLCSETYETEPRTWHSLRTALVETLITLNAKTDIVDAKGRTPLMLAAQAGHMDVILQLLAAGADPLQVNKWKKTAFDFTQDGEILALLKEHQSLLSKKPLKLELTSGPSQDEVAPNGTKEVENRKSSSESFLAAMEDLIKRVEYVEASVDHMSNSNTELTQVMNDFALQLKELKQRVEEKS